MSEFRVIAMASELVEQARATRLSPGYSHPVTAKVATGHGPCRHCLRPFVVGSDVRLLLTFDPFAGVGAIPQPGPIFVHEAACVRYEERAGYPAELLASARCWKAMTRSRWCGGGNWSRMDRRSRACGRC